MALYLITTIAYTQNIDDYLKIAAENNPALKSKFYEYNAALQRSPQVGALPDPQLSFGWFVKPMERYMGDQILSISLMQMFPWVGTLSAAKDEATWMAKAKFETFNEQRTMIFYEVKATYYSLYLLEKEIQITEDNLQILQTLEQIALSRFSSGSTGNPRGNPTQSTGNPRGYPSNNMQEMEGMSGTSTSAKKTTTPSSMQDMSGMSAEPGMVDVLRIQMEILELRNRLELLKDSRKPLIAQFNKLLNRTLDEKVIVPDTLLPNDLPVSLSEIPDSILQNNPMLKMFAMEEASHLAHEKMNRRMGFPMIGLGLQYDIFRPRAGSGHETDAMGNNMWMPMATVTIPLWRKKYTSSVREAEFLHHSVTVQKQDAGNELLVSYEDALKDFRDAERRIQLFNDLQQLAQQALNILMVQYTTAGNDFEELLRMQRQMLDYRLRLLDAIVDQNVAVAMLERLMGR